MTQLFIQDNRVFTYAIHSFIHSLIQGCLLSMDTASKIQIKLHQRDTQATPREMKRTGSNTLPLTICSSGTEPSEKI